MNLEAISPLSAEEFRRLTGVKRARFDERVKLLGGSRTAKRARGGRPKTYPRRGLANQKSTASTIQGKRNDVP